MKILQSQIFSLVVDGFSSAAADNPAKSVDVMRIDLPSLVSEDYWVARGGTSGLPMFYDSKKVTRGGCSAENQKEFLGNVWGHAWEADEAPARAKANGCPFAQGLPAIDGAEHARRKGVFVSALEASLPKAFQFAR